MRISDWSSDVCSSDLHNANRPRRGNNSHELAVDGIRHARQILGENKVAALMTTTKASLGRVEDIVDEYRGNGLQELYLRPLSPYGFAVKTKWFKEIGRASCRERVCQYV